MSYVRRIIQPGEQIVTIGHLHWIIHLNAILLAILALAVFVFGFWKDDYKFFCVIGAGILAVIALAFFIPGWFRKTTTEIAVTNKRIIYKVGFINRHTIEMNIDKVETVTVDQSVFGRLFDYGTVHIRGTGQSLEDLRRIARPIELRNAIETR